jgi:hypothetical protein
MEVVAVVVAMQALAFVIAFGAALALGRARVVLVAGVVIAFVSALVAAVLARGDEGGSLFDFSPFEAFLGVLLAGLFLYAGWALGVAAATRARSSAARRRAALPREGDR